MGQPSHRNIIRRGRRSHGARRLQARQCGPAQKGTHFSAGLCPQAGWHGVSEVSLFRDRDFEEAHPRSDRGAQADALPVDPIDMPVLEEEVPPIRKCVLPSMNGAYRNWTRAHLSIRAE